MIDRNLSVYTAHKIYMKTNIDVLREALELVEQILGEMALGRGAQLPPTKTNRELLKAIRDFLSTELSRRQKVSQRAGERQKPIEELKYPKKALQLRALREKWKSEGRRGSKK